MSNLFYEDLQKKSDGTYKKAVIAKATIKEYAEMPRVEVNGKQYIDKDIFVGYVLNLLEEEMKDALSEDEKRGIEIAMNKICTI